MCTTVMGCALLCKSTGFYSPKVPVPQMRGTREAGDNFKSISLWKVWLESQAWSCFEPILGTLHLCILRTVLCGDTVGDNKPTCNAEWLSMSGEQLYLLTESSTSSCYRSTSAFSEHNRAFEELLKFPCCFLRDRQGFPGWLFKGVFHCNCLLNLDY